MVGGEIGIVKKLLCRRKVEKVNMTNLATVLFILINIGLVVRFIVSFNERKESSINWFILLMLFNFIVIELVIKRIVFLGFYFVK